MVRRTLNKYSLVSCLLALLIACNVSSASGAAPDNAPPAIQQLEKRLFFKNFVNEDLAARVARIEKQMYGEAGSGAVAERVNRLEGVLKAQLADEEKQHEITGVPPSSAAGEAKPAANVATPAAKPTGPSPEEAAENAREAAQAARDEEIAGLLADGVELYRKKKGVEAQAKFSQVLRLNPHNAQAHFNLGIIKESLGNYLDAFSNYTQAAQAEPSNKDYVDAVDAIYPKAEKQKQRAGQSIELKQMSANANAAWKRGEYMSALDLYLQLDAREPGKALVKYNIGSIYMMLKDHNNALNYYKEAHAIAPEEAKYRKAFEEANSLVKKETHDTDRVQTRAEKDFRSAQPGGKRGQQAAPMMTQAAPQQMRMVGAPGARPMQQMPMQQQMQMPNQQRTMQQMPMQQAQMQQMPMQQMPIQQQAPMQQMQMPMQQPMQQMSMQQPMQQMQMPMQQMPMQQPMQQMQMPMQQAQMQMPMQQQMPTQNGTVLYGNRAAQQMPQQQMTMQQMPTQQMQQPMQMQQMPMQMQQQPMQQQQMPMQQMQMPQQQQMSMQEPMQVEQQAPVQQQIPRTSGQGYNALSQAATNSPFAPIMTPTATTNNSNRGAYGVSPANTGRFQQTVAAPLINKASLMSNFGIAGKGNGEGVTVTNIGIASRAAAAGLQKGDDIRAVDGSEVANVNDIAEALSKANTAGKIKFVILRGGNLAVLEL